IDVRTIRKRDERELAITCHRAGGAEEVDSVGLDDRVPGEVHVPQERDLAAGQVTADRGRRVIALRAAGDDGIDGRRGRTDVESGKRRRPADVSVHMNRTRGGKVERETAIHIAIYGDGAAAHASIPE